MKTRTLFLPILALAAAGTFALYSCRKESPQPVDSGSVTVTLRKPGASVPPDSIPSYHRQALDYIAATCDFTGMQPAEVLDACADAAGNFLVNELKYDPASVMPVVADCKKQLAAIRTVFTPASPMDSTGFSALAAPIAQAAGWSAKLRDQLVAFYILSVDPKVTVQEMDLFVANAFDPAAYAGADNVAAAVFTGVWNDSQAYWGPPVIGQKHKGCPYWEYANDAIGAVLGLAFGGFGAAILGPAASAYTYWECS